MKKKNEVVKMRRMKLFLLIEYLRSIDLHHDTFDLEDEGVEGILGEYGIHEDFSEEESEELRKDLYELGERNEFREAAILANNIEIDGTRMIEARI